MKKIIYFIITLIFFQHFACSQNLIPNCSFEIDTACPNVSKIYFAVPWFQPSVYYGNTTNSSSSDLFSNCASPLLHVGIPSNSRGFQYARTDSVYAGIYTYIAINNVHEYIEVPLITPLIANNTYCVEYYVSLANSTGIAISNMGAFFSIDSLLDSTFYAIDYVIPQIENPVNNMLSDTLNWMLVSGSFVATGGEKFMTIGNFHSSANTNTQIVDTGAINRTYYYIEDVDVHCCSCGVGVKESEVKNSNFKLYPNPNSGIMQLEYKLDEKETGLFTVYDISGRLVKQEILSSSNKMVLINAEELNAGAYYYQINVGGNKVKSDKLLIIK